MTVNAKSLAWSAAALLLLLSILSPFNVVSSFLIMTPFVVLYTMMRPGAFAAHVVPIAVAAYLLAGSFGPVVLTLGLFFLIPSIVMGHLYKKGTAARTVLLIGIAVILAQLLVELALFSWLFDIDFSAELQSILVDNMKQLETNGMFEAGWATKSAAAFADAIVDAMPMLLLMSAFLFTIVTHGLSRRALRTVGIQAPAMPQAKTWMMPRSLVLYYLVATIASFALTEDSGGYWTIAIANLIPILQFLFVIQAIGFVFFIADAKRWPRFAPFLLCVPILLFPQPLFLVGMLDVAFSLRRFFVKEQ
ncbi:DUF2232 domain-containing protein [Cohnella sp. GCM10027633]|uniref:DUF2232 domain-containing protein n=1 Tax=unclassified Cohnella TaxID=2636738 RepID=UPI003640E408